MVAFAAGSVLRAAPALAAPARVSGTQPAYDNSKQAWAVIHVCTGLFQASAPRSKWAHQRHMQVSSAATLEMLSALMHA